VDAAWGSSAMGEQRFLIVDDDPIVRRGMSRIIRARGQVFAAATAREGTALVTDGSTWTALFIDLALPDGSGLDVLAQARRVHVRTPAMVLTGSTDARSINAVHDLDARYAVKPVESKRIHLFLDDVAQGGARLERALVDWVSRHALTHAQADVLRRAALGENKDAIACARDCSAHTVQKHVADLLHRTGDGSLHDAVSRLLRAVARL
jgi:DNA-binding NarL/FixJ family response regulator